MEISFKAQGDVQIVEIDGPLGDPEAAAVRVKLEQKINQGRAKVLFDLGNFPLENDAPRKLFLGILSYVVNRGALVACSGVKSSERHLLLIPGNKQIKVFFTRTEGLDYLQKTPVVPPRPAGKGRTEEDIKEESLQKLLERYDVFQHSDEDDPFRLQFLAEQYQATPNREALQIEKKAEDSFSSTSEANQKLELQCEGLAKEVKALMRYRKTPLSKKELDLKEKDLSEEITEVSEAISKLKNSIHENVKAADEAKKKDVDTRKSSADSIRELEEHIQQTIKNNTQEADDLQKQDALEQTNFEAKMKK